MSSPLLSHSSTPQTSYPFGTLSKASATLRLSAELLDLGKVALNRFVVPECASAGVEVLNPILEHCLHDFLPLVVIL